MLTFSDLIKRADTFLVERNWWQFHNPKNDAMNMLGEAGELAECFIDIDTAPPVGEEMADLLFATLVFSLTSNIDIQQALAAVTGDTSCEDSNLSHEKLHKIIHMHKDLFKLSALNTPEKLVLSLNYHVSRIGDHFTWLTDEESIQRAQVQHKRLSNGLAQVIAHLVTVAAMLDKNLYEEYRQKMDKTSLKYPATTDSVQKYLALKDARRDTCLD